MWCAGRERGEPAGVFLRAAPARRAAAGHAPAGGALRQPAGPREGARHRRRRRQAGAVVHPPRLPLPQQGACPARAGSFTQPAHTGFVKIGFASYLTVVFEVFL